MRSTTVGFLLALSSSFATAADMKVVGDQLIVSGKMDDGILAQFRDVAAEYGDRVTTVILRDLTSAGTHWDSARLAADYVRSRGWRTAVSGLCSQSCAIIY